MSDNLRSAIDSMQSTLQTIQSNISQLLRNSIAQHTPPGPTLRVRTSIRQSCTGLCKCNCHQSKNLSSPPWLRGLIGLLFIGYTGSPILNRNLPCSERLCQKNSSSLLIVKYYFPSCFLSRMITLRDRRTPTDSQWVNFATFPASAVSRTETDIQLVTRVSSLLKPTFPENMSRLSKLILIIL